MFSEEKVAQMAAYLLSKESGRMACLKLMKLLYLSDRLSLDRFGEPMSGDRMVSMPHGPVLSQTLDLINGFIPRSEDGWDHWISDREGHDVSLKASYRGRDDLDELSDIDVEMLDSIYAQYGWMSKFQIRDYTHRECSEWENPQGGSHTINPERVFLSLGKSQEVSRKLSNRLIEIRQLEQMVCSLK